jgi:hypothetical protein
MDGANLVYVGPGLPKDNLALLGFSPFEQEDDLSADQYRVYLNSLLGYYGRILLKITVRPI